MKIHLGHATSAMLSPTASPGRLDTPTAAGACRRDSKSDSMQTCQMMAHLRGRWPLAAAADVVVQVFPDGGRARHDAVEEAAQRQRVRQLRQRLPRGLQRCQVCRLQAPQQARFLLLQQRMPAVSVSLSLTCS